jgi:hypothetical protein
MKKRGQVTIFVIIALVIVVSIAGYFIVRNFINADTNADEFSQVFSYYEGCIEQYTKTGISAAGSQGGYLETGAYEAGSNYAPFGNQLATAGIGIPYWLTITSGGQIKENAPTQAQVEEQLNGYIANRLKDCSMDIFRELGYSVSVSAPNVDTTIASDGVLVKVKSIISVSNENATEQKTDFSLTIPSNFGMLLGEAQKLYQHEQESLFLENYSFDVLRLYAPVDGVDIKCSPSIWNAREVLSELQTGLEGNLASLKFDGENDYFNVDVDMEGVNTAQIIYDPSWPSRFEVYGNEGDLLVAKPIGSQAGLNALGFCYVPYHFVYDMMFPVLFRLTAGEDIFQFPIVVVIDKNVPRNAIQSSFSADYGDEADLCTASTKDIALQVRDSLGPVANAEISYKCFDQSCALGATNENGNIGGKVPACLNGIVEISSTGHTPANLLFSSHNTTNAVIYINKEYPVKVKLLVDNIETKSTSFISLVGDSGSRQAVIPDGAEISLAPGFYNLTVYQYGNTSIRIPASTTNQCVEVSAGGIRGIFGATKEQCFDIAIPETVLDSALTAGGQGEVYLPEELLQTEELIVSVHSLPKPTNIETLENNYALFETQGADVIYE